MKGRKILHVNQATYNFVHNRNIGGRRVSQLDVNDRLTRTSPALQFAFLLTCWGESNIETAHNISCAITIVG
jgi:hypothetical protein